MSRVVSEPEAWYAGLPRTALLAALALGCRSGRTVPPAERPSPAGPPAAAQAPAVAPDLVIRILDVGQGDAILVENGEGRVVIDGGPNSRAFGRYLDLYGFNGTTLDAIVLTHLHADHYQGLRELFRSARDIRVGTFYENDDTGLSSSLIELRDSVKARVRRQEMHFRDTDDPCGTGAPACTLWLRGGARLDLVRPAANHGGDGAPSTKVGAPVPGGLAPNDRSVGLLLTAAPPSSFAIWLAGDAERREIAFFDASDYDVSPGMAATVLKANHHGSCNGITARYLDMVRPKVVVISLSARNNYGYVHEQTLALLRERSIPWYRTDVNGTITIRAGASVPGGYEVIPERGGMNSTGVTDSVASQGVCSRM